MKTCEQCGKEIPDYYKGNKCLDCSKANIQKMFKENPDVKKAFQESMEEMKKPETMKKIVDVTCRFMQVLQDLRKGE